jgi:chromosome segregation protein
VFPGVDLTLSCPPCQALLLLSADFDEAKLPDILTVLAIESTPATDMTLKSVELVSPTAVTSLNDLDTKLSQQKFLRAK